MKKMEAWGRNAANWFSCMVWDFTCPDTLAASHLNRAVLCPGAVASDAEKRKSSKYRSLAAIYSFILVAVESLGALGEEATAFFRDVGHRIAAVSSEPKSFEYLMQRLSVTVQRGNAACVLGTPRCHLDWTNCIIFSLHFRYSNLTFRFYLNKYI
jgi:hypothetical protein